MRLHEAAMQYVGVPFRPRSRSKHGMDCSGLLVRSLRDCGMPVTDRIDYGREPWNDGLEESLDETLEAVERPPQVDDVLLMRYGPRKYAGHIAIVGPYPHGGLSLIHTSSDLQKVVVHRMDHSYESKIVKVYSGR